METSKMQVKLSVLKSRYADMKSKLADIESWNNVSLVEKTYLKKLAKELKNLINFYLEESYELELELENQKAEEKNEEK